MNTQCPNCQSNQTKSFRMIYESGTETGKFTVDFGDDLLIRRSGKTDSRTLLARKAAPPFKPTLTFREVGGVLFIAFFAGVVVRVVTKNEIGDYSDFFGFAFGLGVFIVIIQLISVRNSKQTTLWKKEMSIWQQSWMCLKCGQSWMIRQ